MNYYGLMGFMLGVLMLVLALLIGNKPRKEFPNKRISFRKWQREQIKHVKRLNEIAKREGRFLDVSELPVYPKIHPVTKIDYNEIEITAGGNHVRYWKKIHGKWNWIRKPIAEIGKPTYQRIIKPKKRKPKIETA